MKKKVLVIAAHPDDEVLGCGGAIARHVEGGDEVSVLVVAEGITSRNPTAGQADLLVELKKSAKAANLALGVKDVNFLGLPDNRMDSLDLLDVVQAIEKQVMASAPDLIYTHFFNDLNVDHQIIAKAVFTACRPMPGQKAATILMFEVPSSTEWQIPGMVPAFNPNHFVDISGTVAKKLRALESYKSEMRVWPHARSIRAVEYLARWRGACVGREAAEAFLLSRQVI